MILFQLNWCIYKFRIESLGQLLSIERDDNVLRYLSLIKLVLCLIIRPRNRIYILFSIDFMTFANLYIHVFKNKSGIRFYIHKRILYITDVIKLYKL